MEDYTRKTLKKEIAMVKWGLYDILATACCVEEAASMTVHSEPKGPREAGRLEDTRRSRPSG